MTDLIAEEIVTGAQDQQNAVIESDHHHLIDWIDPKDLITNENHQLSVIVHIDIAHKMLFLDVAQQ
jgi:hypothetical protein